MNPANLRVYCGRCNLKVLSPMDIQRDPFREVSMVSIGVRKQIQDQQDPGRVISTVVTEQFEQKPAMICSGCYADETESPTAQPIFVGGKKN
jgi:hypothetical protein